MSQTKFVKTVSCKYCGSPAFAHGEHSPPSVYCKLQQLERKNIQLTAAVAFAYEHLESMENYSLVSGAREVLREALTKDAP